MRMMWKPMAYSQYLTAAKGKGGQVMKRYWIRTVFSGLIFFLAGLAAVTASGGGEQPQGQTSKQAPASGPRQALSYVTNPAGSDYYTMAVGQARVVSGKINIDLSVQPVSPVAIPDVVGSKDAMLGISAAPSLHGAYRGIREYQGKKHPFIRVLQAGHDTLVGIITRTGAGIKNIPDLKGKRFSYDIPTSNLTRNVGILELRAYGLDAAKDTIPLKAEFTDTALRDLAAGRTDAVSCSLSGPKIEELLATKLKPLILPFDPAKIGIMQKEIPALFPAVTLQSGSMPAGVPVVATPALLWAHQDLDEETAYRLVKTLASSVEELKQVHRDFSGWTAQRAVKKLGIPYHPGAIRYYKEAGLWSAEMDKLQAELLK